VDFADAINTNGVVLMSISKICHSPRGTAARLKEQRICPAAACMRWRWTSAEKLGMVIAMMMPMMAMTTMSSIMVKPFDLERKKD